MGLFDFFSNNSADDQKVEVILGLMPIIMNADNKVSDSENLYVVNYINRLNLSKSKQKKLINKWSKVAKGTLWGGVLSY